MESNNVNSNCENVVAIKQKNLNFFLKAAKIEFKMKLQILFDLKFFQMLPKLEFPYLSLYLLEYIKKI